MTVLNFDKVYTNKIFVGDLVFDSWHDSLGSFLQTAQAPSSSFATATTKHDPMRKRRRLFLTSLHAIVHSWLQLSRVVMSLLPVTTAFLPACLKEIAITRMQHSNEQVPQKRRRQKDEMDFLMTGTYTRPEIDGAYDYFIHLSPYIYMRHFFFVHRYGLDTCNKEETEIS